ncbi:Pyridine nucleotide-disulfide oxidoreductase domain-containing protein 1 [Mactra antiquata]
MDYKYVVIGGGIAGVTCAETLSLLEPDSKILLVTASKLIKAVSNYQKVSRTLEMFDVEEKDKSFIETECNNVTVIHKTVLEVDSIDHVIRMCDGTSIRYGLLCICTGGKPKIIAEGNPYVLGIRDTESVQTFQKRLKKARRIVVVGNGGIATELVYEIEGSEVIWAIKDKSITSTFMDPGAATFCLPQLNETKMSTDKPLKRRKYTEEGADENVDRNSSTPGGSALGPDWSSHLEMKGAEQISHKVHVEYKVEVSRILTHEEYTTCEKSALNPSQFSSSDCWPVYVELNNGVIYGCDFVVSATGVIPNTYPFRKNNFDIAEDGGIKVNDKMQTSVKDIYAAGDVCNASWEHASHWLQMRLWSQARQMGAYAAKCMVSQSNNEDIPMDFCFEMFAHVTKFFNYKVIILGKFNAQGLGSDHELLLRVTKGEEYVKAVLQDGRLQGAVLIGETDLEETFENLILNQTDLSPFKDNLLDPNIDIEDFFD